MADKEPIDVFEDWRKVRGKRTSSDADEDVLARCAEACAKHGEWKKALDAADRARVWKVERLDIYKNLLRACERDAQDRVAVKILEKLKMVTQNTEIKIDVDTYRIAFSIIREARKLLPRRKSSYLRQPVDDAELNKLMEEMWDEVYFKVEVLSAKAVNEALLVTAEMGNLAVVLAICNEMWEKDLEQDLGTFKAILLACGHAKKPDEAKVILQTALSVFSQKAERAAIYQEAVLSLSMADQHKDVWKLFEASRREGFPLGPLVCEAVVKSCIKLKKPQWIRPLLKEAHETLNKDLQLDGLAAMVRTLALVDDWERALHFLEHFKLYGLPDASVLNAVIYACFKGGNCQKSMELFHEMNQRHLKPDALTYHIAMLQLVREEDSAGAEELYKAATYQGLFPRWIIRRSFINVHNMNDDLAKMAVRIFVEEVTATKVLPRPPQRELRIRFTDGPAGPWSRETAKQKARREMLSRLLLKEYKLGCELAPDGEIRITRSNFWERLGTAKIKHDRERDLERTRFNPGSALTKRTYWTNSIRSC